MARCMRALAVPFLTLAIVGAAAICGPGVATAGSANHPIQLAQSYGVPPGNVGDGGDQGDQGSSSGDAGLVVRVGQLEEQVRQLNGKIEQLQYANKQLEDKMAKFQQDVEFRFQELGHKGKPLPKRSDLSSSEPSLAATTPDTPSVTASAAPRSGSRDDAFDPSKDPSAPGVPRALGSTSPAPVVAGSPRSGDVASSDDGPITLLSSPQRNGPPPAAPASPAAMGSMPAKHPAAAPAGFTTTPGGTVIADTQANPQKEEFDVALGYLKQKDYEDAERGFAAYIAKNPKNRRVSDALYYLGETYYLRGRPSEAAEQYLKISTSYASSPRAPEAMLRLGEALHGLGAKEQACATFSEIPRKYPNASAAIKASAEREAKRAQCG